jgi:hypothetical protein
LVLGSGSGTLAQPVLNSINPSIVTAGGPQFSLTLLGSGFAVNSVVQVNGSNRATVFVSPLQLTATIWASDIAVPATLQVAVVNVGGGSSKPLPLTVVPPAAAPPPSLARIGPGFAAQGADRAQITLIGANFRPGATVVISPPLASLNNSTAAVAATDIQVLNVGRLSSTLMTALISVGRTASLGLRAVDVVNADGTSTAGTNTAVAPTRTTQPLQVQSSNSLGAPLSVLSLAMSHPRDGTVVMQGQEISAEAILAGAGTGTVIGQWVWDGNVVEQFTATIVGGQSTAVQTRRSLPTWYLGIHTLQLRIVQPNQVATRTISVVVNPGDWRLEALLTPAYGAAFSPDNPPLLRWAPVPGAAKYQVGFSSQAHLATIEKWYDTTDNRWPVPGDVWRHQPEGELFWTVRTVEASGVTRKPLPMRSIFRTGEGGLTSVRATPGRTAAGNTLLEWKPVGQQALYMVTVSSDPGGLKIIRRYLTNSPQVDLRAVDRRLDAGKTYYWKVDALSPSGRLLMYGPTQSFVAAAGPKALRQANGELLQLASLAIPATLHGTGMDLTAQIKKRTPEPDSSVAELQPPVTVEFQSSVNPLDLSLMVDDIDVTPMAQTTENKISYTPAMPLTAGNHSINLVVGTEAVSWKFAIAGAPAATQPVGGTQPGTDAEVPPAVAAATGQSVPPATPPSGTPSPNASQPGQAPAGTLGLTQTSQVSMNTQWASGGNPPSSNALAVAERMSYQDGPWHAEINGSGLLNSVLNPEAQRTSVGKFNDYVTQLAYQGTRWSTNFRFGVISPVLYTDAQLMNVATPRQAGEVVLATPAGTFGYFANTSDLALGGGSGITFHQQIMGASWLAPLPKKWVTFRFMWLTAKDTGTPTIVTFDAQGHPMIVPNPLATASKGSLFGGLLQIHLTPAWLWSSEYAWGHDNQSASDPASPDVFGRAWRTGVTGQKGKTIVNVAYRDVGPNFSNPANPGLTVASKPDLRGVDAAVTQTTNAGTFGLGYSFLQNGVHPVATAELFLHNLNQSWTKPFGPKTNLIVTARESLTQTGAIPAALLGLPPIQQGVQDMRDLSGNVTVSRQIGHVTMSVGGLRDWNRNNILPSADTITSAITLGTNWLSKGFFQLNTQVNLNWVAAEKFTIGETRTITAYIQPTFLWAKRGLQIAPLISVNQGRTLLATDTLTNDTLIGQYGGRLAWTLPGALKFNTLSLQGSYNQNRNTITSLDQRGTQLLVLWTATWGQRKQPM